MTKPVELPDGWAPYLVSLPETGMGYQVCSVRLKDGRKFDQVVIDSGYLARVRGYREIPFSGSDVTEIIVTHDKWDWREEEDNWRLEDAK